MRKEPKNNLLSNFRSDKKRKKKKRRKSKSKSRSPRYDSKEDYNDNNSLTKPTSNTVSDDLMKRDEDARLIFQLKAKRCTTNKNVFAADLSLTEESFHSEEDDATKITISSIEDIPTIGGNSYNNEPSNAVKVDLNKPKKKPLSFEFIGPSRALQKKLQVNKKGNSIAQDPKSLDADKLKENRKKTGPAPKLFLPTEEDKTDLNKDLDKTNDQKPSEDPSEEIQCDVLPTNNNETPSETELVKPVENHQQPPNHEVINKEVIPEQDPKRSQSSRSRSYSRSRSRSYSRSRSRSYYSSRSSSSDSRSRSRSRSRTPSRSRRRSRSASRTPDIPRRRGSPSFLEKRRITR